jgi:hypothetical protein
VAFLTIPGSSAGNPARLSRRADRPGTLPTYEFLTGCHRPIPGCAGSSPRRSPRRPAISSTLGLGERARGSRAALLRQRLKAGGTKMEVNDSWIAATAMARGWPVVTQDDGFPTGIPGLTVLRV